MTEKRVRRATQRLSSRRIRRALGVLVRRPKTGRCQRCGQQFPMPLRGRERQYCSSSCRQRAYEQRRARPVASVLEQLLRDDLSRVRLQDLIREETLRTLAPFLTAIEKILACDGISLSRAFEETPGARDALRQLRDMLKVPPPEIPGSD